LNGNGESKYATLSPEAFRDIIAAEDFLYARTIRSTIPFGTIRRIDLPEQQEGITVLKADDIPGKNELLVFKDAMPLLAREEVGYTGEPIALCSGKNKTELMTFLSQITIQYDKDTPVFQFEGSSAEVYYSEEVKTGKPASVFKNAYQVLEGEYRCGSQAHVYSKPNSVYVIYKEGSLTIYLITQWPFHVRRAAASALGLPLEKIRVVALDTGMHLDGKLIYPSLAAAHAALLACKTGSSIYLEYSWEEDFLYTGKRLPAYFHHRSALDKAGNLLAMEIEIRANGGAYPLMAKELSQRMIHAAAGFYRCKNVIIRAKIIKSNLPPFSPFKGFGLSQVFFALETHTARIAEIAQTDPKEWKLANLKGSAKKRKKGEETAVSGTEEIIELLTNQSDFSRKHAAYELQKTRRSRFGEDMLPPRGIGLSFCFQGNGFSGSREEENTHSIRLRMDTEGKVDVRSAAISENNNIYRLWAGMLPKLLNVDENAVHFSPLDTAETLDSGPSVFSRNISLLTPLLEHCCTSINNQRFRNPLPIEVKRNIRISRVQEKKNEDIAGLPFPSLSWGASVIEVEVDPVTYHIKIRGIWLVVDGGRILDPDSAEDEIQKDIYQALGWAGMEQLPYRRGEIPHASYLAYSLPDPEHIPQPWIQFVNPAARGGSGGIGDICFSCIPAAYISAVSQATGIYIDRLPCSPETIYNYSREQ
jgi:CO/xanthine dehydrogenase Mo-binding subunit